MTRCWHQRLPDRLRAAWPKPLPAACLELHTNFRVSPFSHNGNHRLKAKDLFSFVTFHAISPLEMRRKRLKEVRIQSRRCTYVELNHNLGIHHPCANDTGIFSFPSASVNRAG